MKHHFYHNNLFIPVLMEKRNENVSYNVHKILTLHTQHTKNNKSILQPTTANFSWEGQCYVIVFYSESLENFQVSLKSQQMIIFIKHDQWHLQWFDSILY